MEIAELIYQGELRTQSTHLRSGEQIITDAPPDNQGKGEAFSPTDLLSTSLAACMVTLMGIKSRANGFELGEVTVKIGKYMAAAPRKVERIEINMQIAGQYTDEQKEILRLAAESCPVALSLHPDLKQDLHMQFEERV